MGSVLRDTPLMEVTLRRYEKPQGLSDRELLKKFCLSVGLLQPGDSRDIIVDILHILLRAKQEKRALRSETVKELLEKERKELGLPMVGVAASNVRRQLKRLRDLLIVEKVKNAYNITEFGPLSQSFEERIAQFIIPQIVTRVKEYFGAVDERFK